MVELCVGQMVVIRIPDQRTTWGVMYGVVQMEAGRYVARTTWGAMCVNKDRDARRGLTGCERALCFSGSKEFDDVQAEAQGFPCRVGR